MVPIALLDSSHRSAPVQSVVRQFFTFQRLLIASAPPMHLLPCPSCKTDIPVSPSQAGNQTSCPNCAVPVEIPNLGRLRTLPQADSAAHSTRNQSGAETSVVRSFAFGTFALVAAVCLMVGGYCGIRWVLTDVSLTTEEHIEGLRMEFAAMEPAGLIRAYEDMEEYGLELPEPYKYKVAENMKRAWGRNAWVAGGIGLFSILMALGLAASRPRQPA